jgi:hypothetical protein
MLTAPAPQLAYDGMPGVATLELPVTITIGPVTDNGVVQEPVALESFGLLTYRHPTSWLTEVWDAAAKVWLPEVAPAQPTQLAYLEDRPAPWQAVIVPNAGQQFAKAVGGYPSYSFRAEFMSKAGDSARTGASAEVHFESLTDKNLAIVGPGDGEKPDTATLNRLQLKNTSHQIIGGLVVHRDSLGAEVTLSNAAGASIVLHPDGSIELHPALGQSLTIGGDLNAERITYRPALGGAKKMLG